MKNTSYNFLLGCLVLLCAIPVTAQQDLVLSTMDAVPQHMYMNPASRPQSRINIGLPGMSSFYFRHENTIYNPHHMLETSGNGTAFRTEHFLEQVRSRNTLGADVAVDLLSVGIAVGERNYFSLTVRERMTARLTVPGDLVRFPFTGNASFDELEDGTVDFTDFRLAMNHYREIGLGWQHNLNENWNVGGRVKFLYGYENVDTKTSTMKWKTDETTYDWTFSGEMDVHTSGLWMLADSIDNNSDIENEEYMDYLRKRKNRGLGIDLGAERRINDRLQVRAGILDLGYIKWKSYTKNFNSTDGEFTFTGLELTEQALAADSAFSDSLDVVLEDLIDRLESNFGFDENEASYRSALLARAHVGASYRLYQTNNSSGTASAMIQSEFYKGTMRPTYTVGYSQKVGKWLTANLAYSVIDRNFRNLGAGLSLNGGPVQFYIATDNLLAGVVDKMEIDDNDAGTTNETFVYPAYARTMQVHTGINLTFGNKQKDTDGDGIIDKKDDCPEVPGIAAFNGCPDTDGDGIEDRTDACPFDAGLAEFNGCPDKDGDGIQDSADECPEVAGLEAFNGCPDTDEDGIQDSEDICPEVPGLADFKGCPDTDGDGIEDSLDECVETAGTVEFKGCPDTDGDGIRDLDDVCPNEAGPLANNGCPWGDRDEDGILDNVDACPDTPGPAENLGCPWADADGDTVLDKDDDCPLTPGLVENRGCPVIEVEEQEILNTAFDNLEFLSGKAVIKEESKASLTGLAELLVKKTEWKLKISGHTDSGGNDANNMTLSKQRAQAVADLIESQGVAKDRMVIQWYGETQPIGDNATEEGRQKNRRVEMTVVFD
jgi:outer membrane protein OmpA-like peptidoglycan-associated protein